MRSSAVRLLQRAGASIEAARCGAASAPLAAWLHTTAPGQACAQLEGPSAGLRVAAAAAWESKTAVHSRSIATSATAAAEAQPAIKVDGDLPGVLSAIDAAISSEGASAKDIADAAMSLAYLQARGDRRLWGKVLEKAAAHKSSFDAASLTALLWAANAANVTHFKTLFELSEPAMKLLGSFSPAQLAIVVEGLGGAGVNDPDFYRAVTDKVAAKAGDYSPAQLARILWGYAAAGVEDAKLAKAAAGGVVSGAGNAAAKELAQAAWALAKLRRSDKAALDGLSRALGSKLSNSDAPQDAIAAVWAFAQLAAKPDSGLASKAAGVIKGGATHLTPVQAIHGAWAMAALGLYDKDTLTALLLEAGAAVSSAPEALPVPVLAMLWEASALSADAMGAQAPKLPEQVQSYVQGVYLLSRDAAKVRRGPGARDFRAEVAQATARALGARYKPEVTKAVESLPKRTPDGLDVDIAAELDKDVKVAVEALDASDLTSTTPHTPLGPAAVRRRLLEARGYKAAFIPYPEWAQLKDDKAKAAYVLNAIKAAAPNASSKVSQLQKKLDEPFDPYQ